MTMELGFNMAGTEEALEAALLASTIAGMGFVYLEVGVAEGATLAAVSRWCSENIKGDFRCVGLDLPNCPFIDVSKFMKSVPGNVSVYNVWGQVLFPRTETELFLIEPKDFWDRYRIKTNFCLIDGCHGRACVMKDFHSIAPWIKPGGIVAFHDAMPEDQGKDWQPHCREEINVRTALQNLGLLDNVRDGWKTAGWAHGDKSRQGNGFAFFRKVG